MPFSITIQPAASGGDYLENAALNLAPGAWTQLSGMNGLNWPLIVAAGFPAEHVLEYGHKGVYDPIRRKVRFWGGPHSGNVSATIEYDLATNTWSRPQNAPTGGTHAYDLNTINPANGEHFIRHYFSTTGSRWNGTSWSSWTADPGNGNYWGIDWSPTRNGILAFSEQQAIRFWNGTAWSQLATVTGGATDNRFHYVVAAHKTNGTAWIQDRNNSSVHWRLNADNSVTRLDTLQAPPITLGSSGSNGRFSVYDHRTGRFVVANPFGSAVWDFNLATNTWTSVGNKAPLNNNDASNVEGFVTSISDFGGVILYVMANGTSGTPRAYLYKHN